jgi:hypothetical protein
MSGRSRSNPHSRWSHRSLPLRIWFVILVRESIRFQFRPTGRTEKRPAGCWRRGDGGERCTILVNHWLSGAWGEYCLAVRTLLALVASIAVTPLVIGERTGSVGIWHTAPLSATAYISTLVSCHNEREIPDKRAGRRRDVDEPPLLGDVVQPAFDPAHSRQRRLLGCVHCVDGCEFSEDCSCEVLAFVVGGTIKPVAVKEQSLRNDSWQDDSPVMDTDGRAILRGGGTGGCSAHRRSLPLARRQRCQPVG